MQPTHWRSIFSHFSPTQAAHEITLLSHGGDDGWMAFLYFMQDWLTQRLVREVLAGPSTMQDALAAYIQILNRWKSWLHKKYFFGRQVCRQPWARKRSRNRGSWLPSGAQHHQFLIWVLELPQRSIAWGDVCQMISRRFLEDTAAGRIHREVGERFHQGMGKVELNMDFFCPRQIILPRRSEKIAVEIWFSTCPCTSGIICRKSSYSRHAGKIQLQPISLSCWVFLFSLPRCGTRGQ